MGLAARILDLQVIEAGQEGIVSRIGVLCVYESSRSPLRKTVSYVSALMNFHMSAHKFCNDREVLLQRLSGIPPIIVDGIVDRFTELLRGSSE